MDKHEFFTSRDVVFDEGVFSYQAGSEGPVTVPAEVLLVKGTKTLKLLSESRGSDQDDTALAV